MSVSRFGRLFVALLRDQILAELSAALVDGDGVSVSEQFC